MVRKVIGGFCLLLAVLGFLGAAGIGSGSVADSLPPAIMFTIIGLVLLLGKGKTKEERREQEEAKGQTMVRKVIGWFCLLCAFGAFWNVTGITHEPTNGSILMGIICLIAGLTLLLGKGKTEEEKREREEARERKREKEAEREKAVAQKKREKRKQEITKAQKKDQARRSLWCDHIAGLPLAQFSACTVRFEEDAIYIFGDGNEFHIAYEKITNLSIASDVEIQKSYVSSVGGAVGGAVLFGPLGAMVGGRAKEKTSRAVTFYFVITYNKNGAIDYVSFRITNKDQASMLIKHYKTKISGEKVKMDL